MATPAPCSEERTNFFRVCRVFLDHVPEVLRAVFKDRVQARHGHTWDDTPTSRSGTQWLYAKYGKFFSPPMLRPEQVALLKRGQTKEWDPTLLFHVLRSSALCLLLDEIPGATTSAQRNTTVVSLPTTSQLPAGTKRIAVGNGHKTVCATMGPGSPAQISLPQKVLGKVYVCTVEFEAVDRLREMRNVYFGHKDAAITTQAELESVFTEVEKAYCDLSLSDADIGSLTAIKTEVIMDEQVFAEYQRRLDEFHKQSQDDDDLKRSVDELESKQEATDQRVTSNTQEIEELKGKVKTLSQRVQGNNDVASGNVDNQPDQPPIPMAPAAVVQSRGSGSGSSPSHLTLETAMMTNDEHDVAYHPPIRDPPTSRVRSTAANLRWDTMEPQDTAGGSPQPTLQTCDRGLGASPNTQPLQSLRLKYEYYEDYSRRRFQCTVTYTDRDGCPKTITGGVHSTRTCAKQDAERKVEARVFLEGLQSKSGKRDYKSELEQYFKLLKGLAQPMIKYQTRERRGYQSTVTAPEMGSVTGECCRNKAAAEQNAALHMLQKIQKYAD